MENYQRLNKANWDDRVPAHVASPGYPVRRLVDDPTALSHTVTFDLPRLGEIRGRRGVHLQCHIGTDTLSLARLGARMTGLDFSEAAVQAASAMVAQTGAAPADGVEPAEGQVDFVVSDVYGALSVLEAGSFDFVYTGVGALNWLPDIRRWAGVVAGLLRPGGRLFIREGHPVLWSLAEDRTDGALAIEYPYFETPEPMVFTDSSTYVETDVVIANATTHEWNHGLGEIVTAVLAQGMTLTMLEEHRSVPWEALPGLMSVDEADEWHLDERPERLPMTYTLQAVKN